MQNICQCNYIKAFIFYPCHTINITLKFKGEGSLLYQVVGRYYMPYKNARINQIEPMTITVNYDRTKLVTDDIINVTATVKNNRTGYTPTSKASEKKA